MDPKLSKYELFEATAEKYRSQGFNPIVVKANKAPLWEWTEFTQRPMTRDEFKKRLAQPEAYGVGLVCGVTSGGLEVIDVDLDKLPEGERVNYFNNLRETIGPELFARLRLTGSKSGGYHLGYCCEGIEGNENLAYVNRGGERICIIQTRGQGGQVVAPPTSGYRLLQDVINRITIEERDKIWAAIRSMDEPEEQKAPPPSPGPKKSGELTIWEEYNANGDHRKVLLDAGYIYVKSTPAKEGGQFEQWIRPGGENKDTNCSWHTGKRVFRSFTPEGSLKAEKNITLSHVRAHLFHQGDFAALAHELRKEGFGAEDPAKFFGKNDSPFKLIGDYIQPLDLTRNEITGELLTPEGRRLSEIDVSTIIIDVSEAIYSATKKKMAEQHFFRFIGSHRVPTVNPIKEFFEANKEIKGARSIEKLVSCLPVKSPELGTREKIYPYIRKWLIGMVAQVYGNGFSNVLMPVLVGPINTGKSEFFRQLLPRELHTYRTDLVFSAHNTKDDHAKMVIYMLLLVDELDGLNKMEAAEARKFMSAPYYSYRIPYAKTVESWPRLASLCGTSNDLAILGDPENNRRVIPIEITRVIDFKGYNSINKTELIMEAWHAFMSGEDPRLTSVEITRLKELAKGHEILTKEDDLVGKYIELDQGKGMTPGEIVVAIKSLPGGVQLSEVLLGKALKRQGYPQERTGDKRTRIYPVKMTAAYKEALHGRYFEDESDE